MKFKSDEELSIRGKTRAEKLINVKTMLFLRSKSMPYSKAEYATMRRVVNRTESIGMPWFEQYAIKKGLL